MLMPTWLVEWFNWTTETEVIILIFGLAAVLASLEHISDVGKKHAVLKIVFFVGVAVQALAHIFQYQNAVSNQKKVEAETAMSLQAFAKNDFESLDKTSRDPYIVGYFVWSIKEKREEAVPHLNKAISQGKYVASSYYLLAVYFAFNDNGELKEDLTEAHNYLRRAIANNPDYAPAYYLQAQLLASSKQVEAAIGSLEKAVIPYRIGLQPCASINAAPGAHRDAWEKARNHVKFKELQERCRLIHGLKTTAAAKT
jgi:tetratricopeptide (TPR) repeat protein